MTENFDFSEIIEESPKIRTKFPIISVKSKDPKWKNFPPCMVMKFYAEQLEDIRNFKVFPDDIFLCGFHRSGTTLSQEMIWLIANDFDFEKAKSKLLDERFPMLDAAKIVDIFYAGKLKIDFNTMQRPRTIKNHLPVQFLPQEVWTVQPKIIFISRDPRDVAVSLYYFYKNLMHSEATFEEILQLFLDDKLDYSPYREHTLDYLNIPDYENILYLTYESVTANIDEAIEKVAKFLGKEISEENLKLLKEHLKIENMRENNSVNNKPLMKSLNEINNQNREPDGFIRKGKIGSYKEEMSEEFKEKFEAWMKEFEEMKSSFAENS